MIVDALILAGGRSARLGGSSERKPVSKPRLEIDGVSLLRRTVDAARRAGAREVVVVGDATGVDDVVAVREEPMFGGPVAAIEAGLRALTAPADALLVLACDMPGIEAALPRLTTGFRGDGVIASDGGRRQQLAVAVTPAALGAALAALPTTVDASMRALLDTLDLTEIPVPDGSTDDIDTWDDAARLGAVPNAGALA